MIKLGENMKKEMIKLPPMAAALIITENETQIILPEFNEGDVVPGNVVLAAGIAIMIGESNKELFEMAVSAFKRYKDTRRDNSCIN